MKKVFWAISASIVATAIFTACEKENVQPLSTSNPVTEINSNQKSAGAGDLLYGVINGSLWEARMSDGNHQNSKTLTYGAGTPFGSVTGIAKNPGVANNFFITIGNDGSSAANKFFSFTYNGTGSSAIPCVQEANMPIGTSVYDIEFQPTTSLMYGISNSGYLVKITGYTAGTATYTNIGSQLLSGVGSDFSGCTALTFDNAGKCHLISNNGKIACLSISGTSYTVLNITSPHYTIPAGYVFQSNGAGTIQYYQTLGLGYRLFNSTTGTYIRKFREGNISGGYYPSTTEQVGIVEPCNDYTSGKCGSCPR